MKRLENLLLRACGFTVVVVILFYLFATIGQLTAPSITFGTFMLIFAFGLVIALANLILGLKKPSYILRVLIHYAALLCAFTVIFVINGNITGSGAVFSAIVIFTFLYAVIFALTYLAMRAIRGADRKLDKKSPKFESKDGKKPYKSLYNTKD